MTGRRLLALGVALGVVGCGGGLLMEHEVGVGRFEDAARTFEADSTLWSNPEALLLAGRIYADPSLPTFDIARARAALTRLTTDFPDSEEAERAGPTLGLVVLVGELERVREEQLRALGARTAEMEGRAALADTLTATREAAERDLQTMRGRIELLETELEEARRELERLKAVDLRPRPGSPR